MNKIKTGIHTYKSSSTLNKKTGKKTVEFEKVGVYQNGFVTTFIIILVFVSTFLPQILVPYQKYEWYFAGLVSTMIIFCLNLFWLIGRTGFLSSFRYAIYSNLLKLKFYELSKKLGDNSYYVKKDIDNHKDYHEYCIEKKEYTTKAFIFSWIFNGIVAIIFSLSAIIISFF